MSDVTKTVAGSVENPFDSKQIVSLNDLEQSGFKIARLLINRSIDTKNVEAKKKSLKQYNVIDPIVVVPAAQAIEQKLEIADFKSGNPVPAPADKYFVILDGQHRLEAVYNLQKEDIIISCDVRKLDVSSDQIVNILIEMNNVVKTWDDKEYISIVPQITGKGKYPLIDEINLLTNRGYESRAAYKFLTFKGGSITVNESKKIINSEKLSDKSVNKISNVSGIDRGKNILTALESQFSNDKILLKGRNFPDWIVEKYESYSDADKGNFETDMVSFFGSLTPVQVDSIKTVKGVKGNPKEVRFTKLLDDFFKTFKEMKQLKQTA